MHIAQGRFSSFQPKMGGNFCCTPHMVLIDRWGGNCKIETQKNLHIQVRIHQMLQIKKDKKERKMKKRILSFALALCFVLTLLPAAFADSAPTSGKCGDNLTWTLKDGTLTISGTGDMYDYDDSWDNSAPWQREYGDMITEVVIKQGVTSIGDHAFEWLGNLTSVQLPGSLKSIGASAFRYCYDLESINVSADNSTYSSEDGVLFNKDKTELVMYPQGKTNTSYTVPSSVVRIGEWAFSDCENLESISLPECLTTIGAAAFVWCGLKSIKMPSSE